MRKKLIGYAESQRRELALVSHRVFRQPAEPAVRRLAAVLCRVQFALWLACSKNRTLSSELAKRRDVVLLLCRLEGALRLGSRFRLNCPGLDQQRKICRRRIRVLFVPLNHKPFAAELDKEFASLKTLRNASLHKRVTQLRQRLALWKEKRIHKDTVLSRWTEAVLRAGLVLDLSGLGSGDQLAMVELINRYEALKLIFADHPSDPSLSLVQQKILEELNERVGPVVKSSLRRLEGVAAARGP